MRDEKTQTGRGHRANGISSSHPKQVVPYLDETLSIVLDAFDIAHDSIENPTTSVACRSDSLDPRQNCLSFLGPESWPGGRLLLDL